MLAAFAIAWFASADVLCESWWSVSDSQRERESSGFIFILPQPRELEAEDLSDLLEPDEAG